LPGLALKFLKAIILTCKGSAAYKFKKSNADAEENKELTKNFYKTWAYEVMIEETVEAQRYSQRNNADTPLQQLPNKVL